MDRNAAHRAARKCPIQMANPKVGTGPLKRDPCLGFKGNQNAVVNPKGLVLRPQHKPVFAVGMTGRSSPGKVRDPGSPEHPGFRRYTARGALSGPAPENPCFRGPTGWRYGSQPSLPRP